MPHGGGGLEIVQILQCFIVPALNGQEGVVISLTSNVAQAQRLEALPHLPSFVSLFCVLHSDSYQTSNLSSCIIYHLCDMFTFIVPLVAMFPRHSADACQESR